MLVKIKDTENKWVLFDNAEQLELDHNVETLQSKIDLLKFDPEDGATIFKYVLPEVDLDLISSSNPLNILVLRFNRKRVDHVVVFNTLAYICNDEGKTMEKAVCHGRGR